VADALEDDEAGQLRQVDVEDDQIGALATDRLDRALAVVRADDVVALAAERIVEQLHEVAIVVDDE
jgi:hypothetical protein